MFDQDTLNQLEAGYQSTRKVSAPKAVTANKPRGGLSGFLGNVVHGIISPVEGTLKNTIINPTRELAATFSGNKEARENARKAKRKDLGLGEKGTDFGGGLKKFVSNSVGTGLLLAAPGISTVRGAAAQGAAGGAAAALGEKDSTLGDVLAGGVVGGATGGTLGLAGKAISKVTGKGKQPTGGFMENLTTQGQQAQGRVAGISAGSKVNGKELAPQDTERMLQTLKTEGIKTGNANNTLRDISDKLKGYGQQIADHFKTNNHPLKPEDTKVIADNFIAGAKTTDPRYLKEAQILADDLQKNAKSTKGMWKFRTSLDKRVPDSKFADDATTFRIAAIKDMRQYIAKELGDVPGMQGYHDLSEIKPFISAEAKRLNNPSGGIVGRVIASGPVQKLESTFGKGAEAAGRIGGPGEAIASETPNLAERVLKSRGIPVKYESDEFAGRGVPQVTRNTLTDPKVSEIESAIQTLKDKGFDVGQKFGRTPGSLVGGTERGLTPDFTPIQSSPKLSSVEVTGKRTAIPLSKSGPTEKGIINTPDIYEEIQNMPISEEAKASLISMLGGPAKNFASGIFRQGLSSQAGGAMVPGEESAPQEPAVDIPDETDNSLATTDTLPSESPYAPENIRSSVEKIMAQGGTQKDVSDFLANAKVLNDIDNAANAGSKPLNSTASAVIADTKTGLKQLKKLSADIASSSANNPVVGFLRGKNPLDTNAQNLQASIATAKQIIGKALEGGVLRAEDEKKYAKILPTLNDTDAIAQHKIQQLTDLISSRLSEYQANISGGSGGTDLAGLGL